jgi:hypothetical protein
MLAVVLPPSNLVGDPNDVPEKKPLKNFVTQWGNDPIWLSPFVPGVAPRRENFPLARTAPDPDGNWLPAFAPPEEADQPPGPFSVTGLRDPEMQRANAPITVEVAPHDVFYDEERGLWYCDIEVTWNASYFPFIRLALARYQPASIPGAHLSNVVLADFMPLVPDRWLNVTRTENPRTRQVRVFGHSYESSSSHQEATRGPAGVEVAATSVVEVRVERLEPSWGQDFGWRPEPRAVVQSGLAPPKPGPLPIWRARAADLHEHREFEAILDEDLLDHIQIAPTLWKGNVTLPEADGGTRFRLVIAEYEEYLVDDADPYDDPVRAKGRRLVFVEHVELD